jgi:predicted N-acetyltransferase YhbS
MAREDRPPTVLIRPATAADIPAFLEVMSIAFGVPNRRPSVHTWAFEQDDGHLLVAERDGRVIGTGASIGFGSTAWIGAIAVRPEARGERLGDKLTEAAIEAVGERDTLLLLASPLGRRIYERMGFEPERAFRVFYGPAHAKPAQRDDVRPATEADYAGIRALDVLATGEDRHAAIDSGLEGSLVADGGVALRPPFAARPIIATDANAGRALLDAVIEPGIRLAAPQANVPAVEALLAHGCEERHGVERMRRGAPVTWNPELQWGVFSLFFA